MAIPPRCAHRFSPNDTCGWTHVLCVCRRVRSVIFFHTHLPSPLHNLAHLLATALMHRSTLDALNRPLNQPLNAT